MRILEVGCGVGNLVLPLLEGTQHIFYACDFSPRAVYLLKARAVLSSFESSLLFDEVLTCQSLNFAIVVGNNYTGK